MFITKRKIPCYYFCVFFCRVCCRSCFVPVFISLFVERRSELEGYCWFAVSNICWCVWVWLSPPTRDSCECWVWWRLSGGESERCWVAPYGFILFISSYWILRLDGSNMLKQCVTSLIQAINFKFPHGSNGDGSLAKQYSNFYSFFSSSFFFT